ncbi:MAG TPA: YdbH domain-containing protein, partial [Gammaproteobacteria bacterium]|nr:YdbH domain-containing protein [Gammaproteobacteria bacterium]
SNAGFAEVTIAGASLGPRGFDIERLQLAAGDAFVVENIRASITTNGITEVSIGSVFVEAELDEDAELVLPGFAPGADGPRSDVLDLVPVDGIRLDRGDIRLATPWREVLVSIENLSVQRDSSDAATATAEYSVSEDPALGTDAAFTVGGTATATLARGGAIEARLEIAAGAIDTAGFHADGLAGAATASVAATAAPVVELELDSTDTRFAGMVLGPLSLEAALRDGLAELGITSSGSEAVDLVVDGHAQLTDSGPLIDLTGRASFRESTRGELAFELTGVSLGDETASGRLHLSGRGLSMPGLVRQGAIDAAADIEGNRDQLRLTATSAWTFAFVPDDAIVPAAMQGTAEQSAAVTIMSRSDGPLVLSLSWADATAEFEAAVQARAGSAVIEAGARVAASWAARLAVTADELNLNIIDLPWQALTLGVDGFEGQAAYGAAAWDITGAGTVRASGALGEVDLIGLSAQWAGSVSGTPAGLTAMASECVDWAAERIVWRSLRISGFAPACLRSGAGELLAWDAASGRTRFAASTAAGPLHVVLERDDTDGAVQGPATRYEMRGTWPEVRLTGAIGSTNGVSLSAAVADGALRIESSNVAIAGLSGAAVIRAGALQSWSVNAATIEHLAEPAWWAPVTLEANAELQNGALAFQAYVSDALGTFVVEATGRTLGGIGASDIMLYPVQLIEGATQLGDISPLLAEFASGAEGSIGFDGTLEWNSDGLDSSGTLSLEGFGATVAGIPVGGLDTQTRFASLWPLATQPEQTAEIAMLSLGMPLENGRVVFDVDAERRIAIHDLAFDIAGGRIHSEAFTLDSADADDIVFRLLVEDVELSQMLELSEINGLQGTGILSGSIPVRIAANEVHLDAGRLAADSRGTLAYTPSDLPAFLRGDDQRTQMLREALTNFEYDELSVTVSGDSSEGGQQTVRFDALGANPDFLGGHPIELAFTFTGPLLGAMSSAVSVTGAAEIDDFNELQQLNNLENTQ